jgi:hypothetical protein
MLLIRAGDHRGRACDCLAKAAEHPQKSADFRHFLDDLDSPIRYAPCNREAAYEGQ